MYLRRVAVAVLMLSIQPISSVLADAPVESTVEGLYTNKAQLAKKQVQVKGKVVKVTNGVMQRNFLHIQDGSGAQGTNDITVTSQQTANIGDEVIVTGQLATDVDFTSGYAYPILIEQATIQPLAKK